MSNGNSDSRQPQRVAFDFPMPTFHPCRRCGVPTTSAECHTCWMRGSSEEAMRQRTVEREHRAAFELMMPPWSKGLSLDDPNTLSAFVPFREAIERARRAIAVPKVVLLGPTGSGKTVLAAAMLRAWFRRTLSLPAFVPTFRLSGGKLDLPPSIEQAPLLVLDGVGSERVLASNLVPSAVSARDFQRRPVWVTTQLDEDALAGRYAVHGEETARKIYEHAVIVPMDATTAESLARRTRADTPRDPRVA